MHRHTVSALLSASSRSTAAAAAAASSSAAAGRRATAQLLPRFSSSDATSNANASKGQADAAPPSQQAAEQVGRDEGNAATPLKREGSAPISQEQADAALAASSSRQRSGPTSGSRAAGPPRPNRGSASSPRMRPVATGSNKGAPSTGRGTNGGRGANVSGATSQNRRTRPSAASAGAKELSGGSDAAVDAGAAQAADLPPDVAVEDALDAVEDASPKDLLAKATRPHRQNDRPKSSRAAQYKSVTREGSGERGGKLSDALRRGMRGEGWNARSKAGGGGGGGDRRPPRAGSDKRRGPRNADGEEEVSLLQAPGGGSREHSGRDNRNNYSAARRQAPPALRNTRSINEIVSQLETNWYDPLRRSPTKIGMATGIVPAETSNTLPGPNGSTIIPPAPKKGDGAAASKSSGAVIGTLQPIVVPPERRQKLSVNMLRLSMTGGGGEAHGRVGYEAYFAPRSTSRAIGASDSLAPALPAPMARPTREQVQDIARHAPSPGLASSVEQRRKQLMAEVVGGDYSQQVLISPEQVGEALQSTSPGERAIAQAKQALGLNPTVSAAGKGFVAQGVEEKLKELRV